MPRPKPRPKPVEDFTDLPSTTPPEPEPTINLLDTVEPPLPGFFMEDAPDTPDGPSTGSGPASVFDAAVLNKAAQRKFDEQHPNPQTMPLEELHQRASTILNGEIIAPTGPRVPNPSAGSGGVQTGVVYESRIRVLEAYQYPGNLKDAPSWIDRSWAGYGDWDPLRNIQAGPAIRVPLRGGGDVLCRPGDYVVRQEVVLAHGVPPDVQVEVWEKQAFERTFIPTDEPDA